MLHNKTENATVYFRVCEAASKVFARKKNLEGAEALIGEIREAVWARNPPHLLLSELKEIMTWKLNRGKFRPSLPGLIASNPEEAVKDATTACFALIGHPSRSSPSSPSSPSPSTTDTPSHTPWYEHMDLLSHAISKLTVLRGVGVATATAVLHAVDPAVAFMSDEALKEVTGSVGYKLKDYKDLVQGLLERAQVAEAAHGVRMTPGMCERAIWVAVMELAIVKEESKEMTKQGQKTASSGSEPAKPAKRRR